MNGKYIVALFCVALIGFTSCKKNNGCARSEKAWVRDFSESDSCGIVFELEDGTKLEPTNLAEFEGQMEFTEGALAWISYKEVDGASTCQLGTIVKIRCVSEREY